MIPDGEYTAVVDRFEDDLAVLEVSGEDELYELVVEKSQLPEDGRHVDAILKCRVESEELVKVRYLPKETEQRRDQAQNRFDRLSKRPADQDNSK